MSYGYSRSPYPHQADHPDPARPPLTSSVTEDHRWPEPRAQRGPGQHSISYLGAIVANAKQTSRGVARKASSLLRSSRTTKGVKSVAASALAQTTRSKKK
ncbi:hypothetical protein C4K88_03990 [Arthrobacter pityocampae]|uniref:Uncharacterized protein n=1 Tax=Arthrobacter pityocampae TaxID=547334 RepID=A0A2S5IZE3_9MICC|nr:hypothetical protein C4K88_03990 [Arthrobacter pityocampae]